MSLLVTMPDTRNWSGAPIEGDALLSAIDLLAAGNTTAAEPAHSPDMPAGVAGDMPR